MLRKLGTGELLHEPSRLSVKEYLEHWLETAAKPRLTEHTHGEYSALMRRYIIPKLGATKLTKTLRLPKSTLHQLRKVYASYVARNMIKAETFSLKRLQALLGHSSPDSAIKIYTQIIEQDTAGTTFDPFAQPHNAPDTDTKKAGYHDKKKANPKIRLCYRLSLVAMKRLELLTSRL